MRKIGIKEISGPGAGTKSHRPCCQTKTVRPKALPTESKKPSAATSGTKSERKTKNSSKMARPTTIARYTGMASSRRSVISSWTAVKPVIPKSAPVASSMRSVASRRALATPTVAASVGEVCGETIICAAWPSSLRPTICAWRTPPTRLSASAVYMYDDSCACSVGVESSPWASINGCNAGASALIFSASTMTKKGPLTPG